MIVGCAFGIKGNVYAPKLRQEHKKLLKFYTIENGKLYFLILCIPKKSNITNYFRKKGSGIPLNGEGTGLSSLHRKYAECLQNAFYDGKQIIFQLEEEYRCIFADANITDGCRGCTQTIRPSSQKLIISKKTGFDDCLIEEKMTDGRHVADVVFQKANGDSICVEIWYKHAIGYDKLILHQAIIEIAVDKEKDLTIFDKKNIILRGKRRIFVYNAQYLPIEKEGIFCEQYNNLIAECCKMHERFQKKQSSDETKDFISLIPKLNEVAASSREFEQFIDKFNETGDEHLICPINEFENKTIQEIVAGEDKKSKGLVRFLKKILGDKLNQLIIEYNRNKRGKSKNEK